MADEWRAHLDATRDLGTWIRWGPDSAPAHPELPHAVASFEAFGGRNGEAAHMATRWFREDAKREHACVTRLLLLDGRVITFYALASGEARLTSSKKLERMGIHGGQRVGSSHIEWIARDRRADAGSGLLAVQHAIYVATRVAREQGNRALTLDPFDQETQRMWRAQGFHPTQTELGDGLRRLYVPLFGLDYGRLPCGA